MTGVIIESPIPCSDALKNPKFNIILRSVCKVRTQDIENFDEELESLASARKLEIILVGADVIQRVSWSHKGIFSYKILYSLCVR